MGTRRRGRVSHPPRQTGKIVFDVRSRWWLLRRSGVDRNRRHCSRARSLGGDSSARLRRQSSWRSAVRNPMGRDVDGGVLGFRPVVFRPDQRRGRVGRSVVDVPRQCPSRRNLRPRPFGRGRSVGHGGLQQRVRHAGAHPVRGVAGVGGRSASTNCSVRAWPLLGRMFWLGAAAAPTGSLRLPWRHSIPWRTATWWARRCIRAWPTR